MNNLQTHINNYINYCAYQKRLDKKTLKSYRIDLRQFYECYPSIQLTDFTHEILEEYIRKLYQQYKPKTVKRKIASLKAFFRYLEYKEILDKNPFTKIQVRFREPTKLPKTIPLNIVELFLSTIYKQRTYSYNQMIQKHHPLLLIFHFLLFEQQEFKISY